MKKILVLLVFVTLIYAQTTVQQTAQSSRVPYACPSGTYWTGQGCGPCQSVSYGYCNCSTYLGCTSIMCQSGTIIAGANIATATCMAPPLGATNTSCLTWGLTLDQTAVVCYSCSSGFTLIGGACVTTANCAQYSMVTAQCQQCAPQYYFNWQIDQTPIQNQDIYYQEFAQVCTACMSNCQSCSSGSICNQCSTGYYWSPSTVSTGTVGNGYCASCSNGCGTCTTNGTVCTACVPGYYLYNSTCTPCANGNGAVSGVSNCTTCSISGTVLTCTACQTTTTTNYTLSTTNNLCISCYPNAICSTGGTISSCMTGFFQTNLTTCTNCGATCTGTCTQPGGINTPVSCSACADLYYLTTSNNIQTCALCSSSSLNYALRCAGPLDSPSQTTLQPTQCATGYFLVTANGVTSCVQSSAGNTCLTLSTNVQSSCATCLTGNYLTGTTCSACLTSTGCLCATGNTCSSCATGYSYTAVSSVVATAYCTACGTGCTTCTLSGNNVPSCTTCSSGYVANSATPVGCVQCVSGCTTCSFPTGTTSFTQANTSCSQCLPGYYASGTSCTQCPTGCSACTAPTTGTTGVCTTCSSGYFLSTNTGLCAACQSNCMTCTYPGNTCSACASGYISQNGGCVTLAAANCVMASTNSNGCAQCIVGFALATQTNGSLTQNFCVYCLSPYAGFVCRQNMGQPGTPNAITAVTTTTVTVGAPNTTPQTSTGYVARVSNACQNGWYFTGQSCQPCSAGPANGYCTCSSYNTCTTVVCNTNYASIGGQCMQIPTGCATYALSNDSTTLICTLCQAGYTMIANICILNNGCSTFTQTTAACTACQSGYYLNYVQQNGAIWDEGAQIYYIQLPAECTSCAATIPNCVTCPSATTCTTCVSGFYWQESTATAVSQTSNLGQCVSCGTGCTTCSAATNMNSTPTCTQCASAYQLISTTNTCSLCSTITSNCTVCSNNACTACLSGYQLLANLTVTPNTYSCVQCPSYCSACSGLGVCTSCLTGYLNTTQNQCMQCSSIVGCLTCSANTGSTGVSCTMCADTYFLIGTQGSATCSSCSNTANGGSAIWVRCAGIGEGQTVLTPTQCIAGYYLVNVQTSNGSVPTCVASVQTPATCLMITATTQTTATVTLPVAYTCQSCLYGYTLYTNQCLACNYPGCTTCTVATGSSVTTCSTCATTYYLGSSNNCISCTTWNIACNACTNQGCTACGGANYYYSGQCIGCLPGCSACQSPTSCTTCSAGYFQATVTVGAAPSTVTNTVCYACQMNCATCTAPGTACTACNSGFVLSNGGCISLANANCVQSGGTGCTLCSYGFYQSLKSVCAECIAPQSEYVCRANQNATNTNTNTTNNTTNNTTTNNTTNGTTPTVQYAIVICSFIALLLI